MLVRPGGCLAQHHTLENPFEPSRFPTPFAAYAEYLELGLAWLRPCSPRRKPMSLSTLAAAIGLALLATSAFGCLTWRRTLARRALIGGLAILVFFVALSYGNREVRDPTWTATLVPLVTD